MSLISKNFNFNHMPERIVYRSLDNKFMYLYIPKNASCYLKEYFEGKLFWRRGLGSDFINETNNTSLNIQQKYIVPLRDPVQRWKSGIVEFYFIKEWAKSNFFDFLNFASKEMFCDAHTMPQICLLDGLDTDNIIFLKVNHLLTQNLQNFSEQELNAPYINHNDIWRNSSRTNPDKAELCDMVEQYLKDNSNVVDNIKKYYEDDYKLFNEVTFYGFNGYANRKK